MRLAPHFCRFSYTISKKEFNWMCDTAVSVCFVFFFHFYRSLYWWFALKPYLCTSVFFFLLFFIHLAVSFDGIVVALHCMTRNDCYAVLFCQKSDWLRSSQWACDTFDIWPIKNQFWQFGFEFSIARFQCTFSCIVRSIDNKIACKIDWMNEFFIYFWTLFIEFTICNNNNTSLVIKKNFDIKTIDTSKLDKLFNLAL